LRFGELIIDDIKFKKSVDLNSNDYWLSGGGRTIFSINIDAIYSPIQDTVAFPLYFVLGAGYFSLGSSTIEVTNGKGFTLIGNKDLESALLLNVGLGLRLKISKTLRCYIECAYSLGCTSYRSTGYIPLRIGLSADF
jgi:hypothetical protein